MNLSELNKEVSQAIFLAETLEKTGHAERAAFQNLVVSQLEEQIAALVPANVNQGAIARRGVVRAALRARDLGRAIQKADDYLAEIDIPQKLAAEIQALRSSAQTELDALYAESPPMVLPVKFRFSDAA